MFEMHASFFQILTAKQVNVYENIMATLISLVRGLFFLYGYGCTGKTFM